MWLVYCIGLKHVYITLTRSHLMTSNNPGEGSGVYSTVQGRGGGGLRENCLIHMSP